LNMSQQSIDALVANGAIKKNETKAV
jgi:hypothetical protein